MMNRETALFLVMVICGAGISILYDFFRAVRVCAAKNTLVTILADVTFCALSALCAAACVWNFGNGAYRFYEPLGMLLGMVFYFLLLGKWVFKFFLFFIKNILKILLTPVHFLDKILKVRSIPDSEKRSKDTHV